MRILMTLSQTEVTGAEVYATSIADELIARGHEVFILSDTLHTPTQAHYTRLDLDKRSLPRRARYVAFLVRFIRQHGIHVVHAHSRAAMWVSRLACRLTGTPMVSTIHALEPTHLTRRLNPAFGHYAVAVCERARDNVVARIGYPPERIEVLRNGFRLPETPVSEPSARSEEKRITLIGRLSSTKGAAAYRLLEEVLQHETRYRVTVVGGRELPERFRKFTDRIEFVGQVPQPEVARWMARSALVIGSGRVAVEALLLGRRVLAFGAFSCPGLVTEESLPECLATNFGDISFDQGRFDWGAIRRDIARAAQTPPPSACLRAAVAEAYRLDRVVDRLEFIYRSVYVRVARREIPVLCYHRLITAEAEAGQYPTYLLRSRFEEHLRYLQQRGFETLFASELSLQRVFDPARPQVVLTFDDGYVDNLTVLLPLLRQYGMKATIFTVMGLTCNEWDIPQGERPLALLNADQRRELLASGLVELGAHTLTHPDLTSLPPEAARREIGGSCQQLEHETGRAGATFAYPYGRVNPVVEALARQAGLNRAFATDSGPAALHEAPLRTRRIILFPNTTLERFRRKVTGHYRITQSLRWPHASETHFLPLPTPSASSSVEPIELVMSS